MPDKPDLFTEVLRRAEERRGELKEAITHHENTLKTCEASLNEAKAILAWLRRELTTVEHIIEPLAGHEVAWCDTAKAQPWCQPEQHKTRRDREELGALVLAAVYEMPGVSSAKTLAKHITARTGKRILVSTVRARLKDHWEARTIEQRDERWYPVSIDRGGRPDHSGGTTAPAGASAPALTQSTEQLGSVTLVQGCEDCQRDAQALSEAHTASSPDYPAEIPSTTEDAAQEPPASPATPTSEVTLDFIRRAGPPGLDAWQLNRHQANLLGLMERRLIEQGEDGQYRYVDRDETTEAAK